MACYGFASAETIAKNLAENPALGKEFPVNGAAPDEKFLKDSVTKMFSDLDAEEDKGRISEIIRAIHAHI